ELYREAAAERLAQRFNHGVGARTTRGIDDEPTVLGIDPRARERAARERTRTQLFRDALLELAHLAPTDRIALLLLELRGALARDLPDDRGGQQLLFNAERDQVMPVAGVHVALRDARVHPAARLHVERPAGLQRMPRAGFFQLGCGNRPFGCETINDEIFEPHGERTARAQRRESQRVKARISARGAECKRRSRGIGDWTSAD